MGAALEIEEEEPPRPRPPFAAAGWLCRPGPSHENEQPSRPLRRAASYANAFGFVQAAAHRSEGASLPAAGEGAQQRVRKTAAKGVAKANSEDTQREGFPPPPKCYNQRTAARSSVKSALPTHRLRHAYFEVLYVQWDSLPGERLEDWDHLPPAKCPGSQAR